MILRNKIRRQILEAEIKNKYRKKRELEQQLKEDSECLANKIGFICKIVLSQKIKNIIPNRKARCNKIHYDKNREIEIRLPKIWQTKTLRIGKYHSQFFIAQINT